MACARDQRGKAGGAAELAALRPKGRDGSSSSRNPKPVAKAEKPDPLLDPEGYAKAVREEIRRKTF
jgi:hypothetical protein